MHWTRLHPKLAWLGMLAVFVVFALRVRDDGWVGTASSGVGLVSIVIMALGVAAIVRSTRHRARSLAPRRNGC